MNGEYQSGPATGKGISTESLWKMMDRVEASITGINSKASILFYLNGFLLTNLALQWPRFFASLKGHGGHAELASVVAVLAMGLAILGTMVSLWASYSAILPGNVAQGKVTGPLSLVFFAHISSRTVGEYRDAVEACTEVELRTDLQAQIHSLSLIVLTKQRRMRLAVQSAMVLSIPGLVVLMGLYLLRAN